MKTRKKDIIKRTKSTEIKGLSPKEKRVAAKVLKDQGFSTRKMEQLLGMDRVTAWRASKEATPKELKQFETDFTQIIQEMKLEGIFLVQKRMLQLIPKEFRIDQLIKAGEYFEGRLNSSGDENKAPVQNNININVDKYMEDVEEVIDAEN